MTPSLWISIHGSSGSHSAPRASQGSRLRSQTYELETNESFVLKGVLGTPPKIDFIQGINLRIPFTKQWTFTGCTGFGFPETRAGGRLTNPTLRSSGPTIRTGTTHWDSINERKGSEPRGIDGWLLSQGVGGSPVPDDPTVLGGRHSTSLGTPLLTSTGSHNSLHPAGVRGRSYPHGRADPGSRVVPTRKTTDDRSTPMNAN